MCARTSLPTHTKVYETTKPLRQFTAGIVPHLKFLYNVEYGMTGEIDKLLFEYDCTGKAVFRSSGQTQSADFSLRQLRDGTIAGAVTLLGMTEGVSLTMSISNPGVFDLEGLDKEQSFAIRVEGCHFTHMVSGANALQGEFIAFQAFVKLDALETKLVRPAFVAVSVTNMYKTFRVIVQSPLGRMQVAHELDIENLERLMTYQRISLVTSQIQIFADNAVGMSVKDLIEQTEHTVRGFLYVTRLAQTCWHDWCSISIYEKNEDETITLRAVKMRLPWKKPPVARGISVVAHSDFFIKNAYAGYNDQLETRHGFETALHWYVESNATEVMESKYLLACTCLELLADRHVKTLGTEFILDGNLFGHFYETMKNVASRWLKKNGVQSDKKRWSMMLFVVSIDLLSGTRLRICYVSGRFDMMILDLILVGLWSSGTP